MSIGCLNSLKTYVWCPLTSKHWMFRAAWSSSACSWNAQPSLHWISPSAVGQSPPSNILHSTPIPYMLLLAQFELVSVSLNLLYLTLKGRRGSMYDKYMQFLQASPSLIFNSFKVWGFEILFSTLSYVKDKINIFSYLTLMTKYKVCVCIQGH